MTRLLLVAVALASAVALQLAGGCSQSPLRGKAAASAPSLTDEGQAHIRGVSDPNAPFTLIDRHRVPSTRAQSSAAVDSGMDSGAALPCRPQDLQVYEAAAAMNGASRVLTLAIKNRGASSCRLSGYPSLQLRNEEGEAVAGIAIRQTGALEVSGRVISPPPPSLNTLSAGQPSPDDKVNLVLHPSGVANFQIGWSSGDECPLVSSFSVALAPTGAGSNRSASAAGESTASASNKPAAGAALTGAFTINHALNVCNSEIEVTSLRSGGSV